MQQEEEKPLPVEDDEPVLVTDEESKPAEEDEPLPLDFDVADTTVTGGLSSNIKTFGGAADAGRGASQLTRPMNVTGAGATRCRIFHSKITIAALEHMTNQINEWLDGGEIEIKHVTEVVGVMEGKKSEPNVIVIAWF